MGSWGRAWAWETGIHRGHRQGLWGLRGGERAGADRGDWTRHAPPLQGRWAGAAAQRNKRPWEGGPLSRLLDPDISEPAGIQL